MTLPNNTLDGVLYEICDTQGQIFEYIANEGYDVFDFADKCMRSDFIQRWFDTPYSRFQIREPEESLDFIMPEIGTVKQLPDSYFKAEIAYWLGFIYRGLYIATNIPSRKLIDMVPIHKLAPAYIGLHTLDEITQLERIIEDFNL